MGGPRCAHEFFEMKSDHPSRIDSNRRWYLLVPVSPLALNGVGRHGPGERVAVRP